MAFELEALVGHLYVAGGRTIKTTPPGALCEVAPKRASRGRELDTFFVMVLPSGTIAPNTFYEQMSLMAAERFFSQGGSVTSALRDVFNTLNNNLYEHNQSGRKHYEANMIAAVLRGDDLYIARTGACAAILRQDDETITYPDELSDEDLFQPPLGVRPIPEVPMKRYPVQKHNRLLLADANIAEITSENIDAGLQAKDIEALLDDFKTRVSLQIQMMAIEFVPPDETVMVPAITGESTAVLSAEIAAARAKANNRSATREKKPNPVQARAKEGVIQTSRTTGHVLSAVGDLLQTLFGGKPTEAQRQRNRTLITASVVGFPAIILLVVILSWVGGVGETAFEECVARAVSAAQVARNIPSDNPQSTVTAWQGTLQIIENDCEELRPDYNDPTLTSLVAEGRDTIDRINQISRRQVTTVATLPVDGANIGTVVLQGLDMYALDDANNLVYRMQLSEDGLGIAGQVQPITSMRNGATVDGLTVGSLIDIAFDSVNNQIVSLSDNGVLVRCPPRFINECEAQRVLGSELWQTPIKITMWQSNLYVLDTGARQLWRYQPSGGTFASQPTEYFSGDIRPAYLDNAVDFDISEASNTRGTVYILYADGIMTPYFSGQAETFQYRGFREEQIPTNTATQAMYLNDNPIDPSFFIISRQQRTIYKATLGGTWNRTYRIVNQDLFERLNDVVVDSGQGIVYAASGNSIFGFPEDR